jgi:glycosyltransferase involved in cell wall biosynthesis
MNESHHSPPHVAVIGSGLERCRDVPGFAVDLVGPTPSCLGPGIGAAGYDLLHVALSEPAGTAVLRRGQDRSYLSPGRAADRLLTAQGAPPERIRRWRPGIDRERFTPAAYRPEAIPSSDTAGERINLLHVACPTATDAEIALLADAFGLAHDRDHRLHLVLAGDVRRETAALRDRALHDAFTGLGELSLDALAQVYATADLLIFTAAGDLLAEPVLEAQASGLPVLALDAGTATELIESGRNGCLVEPSAPVLAAAISGLARRATLRERLVTGALMTIGEHGWERALDRLAVAWAAALAPAGDRGREVARAA